MFIAFEGVDGSGKSTLVEAVAAYATECGYEPVIIHFGPPKTDDPLAEMIDHPDIAGYTPTGNVALIADRLHFGGPVYGPVYRPDKCVDEYGDLGKGSWRYAELFFEARGLLTTMVSSPQARERMIARGDDYADPAHLDDLQARYDVLVRDAITVGVSLEMQEMRHVWTAAVAVVHAARSKERGAVALASHRGYVGPRSPDVVIVMNPDRRARLDVLSALDQDDWRTVGVASALEAEDSLQHLIATLHYPYLIGYGRLNGHVENVIARYKGDFVSELGHLVELVHLAPS